MIVRETDIKAPGVKLLSRGKVRDVYEVEDSMLLVATDRLSAFDVVLPDPIPDKGKVLTGISCFWFKKLGHIIPNHIIESDARKFPETLHPFIDILNGRSMLVKKASPLPIECIVRGYITGSGWKDYQNSGEICGIRLPEGLKESEKLPEPLFTPSTKAAVGEHDENISFEQAVAETGEGFAEQAREISLELYRQAGEYALSKGIIIADTKFEFGVFDGKLILIDEVLTPDSSRFWPADLYEPGKSQPSFDKQFVRDYLTSVKWNKRPPAPVLPVDIINMTVERYLDAYRKITGMPLNQ